MHTIEKVKEYLLEYLGEQNNNQKVICISGKWGIGKTYFWREIEKDIEDKRKNIKQIYYSLYGKSSIEEVKHDLVAKITNSWNFDRYLGDHKMTKSIARFAKTMNRIEADRRLKKQDFIICLDDFERKSKNLDLNDLFGLVDDYISVDNNKLKIVLIFNHEEFKDIDGAVYVKTKEKIISKFIEFNPSIKELFELIFYARNENNDRVVKEVYKDIEEYQDSILTVISNVGDKNGRTYKKILDNIVEWKKKDQVLNEEVLKALIISTMNFIYHNMILDCKKFENGDPGIKCEGKVIDVDRYFIAYDIFDEQCICKIDKTFNEFKNNTKVTMAELIAKICTEDENCKKKLFDQKDILFSIYRYGFCYRYDDGIHPDLLSEIHRFIKTGII